MKGNLIIALGDKKDYIRAHKVLPIKGDAADADIDADFRTFSKALHNYAVTNKTAKEELMKVANAAITNGSKLSWTGFEVNKATYENEGKIVMYFELTNKYPKVQVWPSPPGYRYSSSGGCRDPRR